MQPFSTDQLIPWPHLRGSTQTIGGISVGRYPVGGAAGRATVNLTADAFSALVWRAKEWTVDLAWSINYSWRAMDGSVAGVSCCNFAASTNLAAFTPTTTTTLRAKLREPVLAAAGACFEKVGSGSVTEAFGAYLPTVSAGMVAGSGVTATGAFSGSPSFTENSLTASADWGTSINAYTSSTPYLVTAGGGLNWGKVVFLSDGTVDVDFTLEASARFTDGSGNYVLTVYAATSSSDTLVGTVSVLGSTFNLYRGQSTDAGFPVWGTWAATPTLTADITPTAWW